MIPVLAALHKAAEIPRQHQCFRRVITQKHNLSVQNFLYSPVRPFCSLILGKRRIPCILSQLLQHPTVQDPVNLKLSQPFLYLLQKLLMDQILHIKNLYQSVGPDTYIIFFHLQPGIPQTLPYQRRITFHTVGKSFSGASEYRRNQV